MAEEDVPEVDDTIPEDQPELDKEARDASQSEGKTDAPTKKQKPTEVKYLGPSTNRIISQEDWEAIGVENQKTSFWGPVNNWSIPISRFTEAALKYIAEDDPSGLLIR